MVLRFRDGRQRSPAVNLSPRALCGTLIPVSKLHERYIEFFWPTYFWATGRGAAWWWAPFQYPRW